MGQKLTAGHKDALFRGDRAKEYDKFELAVPHYRHFQATVGRLVEMVAQESTNKTRKRITIAECGVGTGNTLEAVTKTTHKLRKIKQLFAVDASPEMIEIAIRRVKNPKVIAVREDFLKFLIDRTRSDQHLDCIYSAYTIHNLRQEQQLSIFRGIFEKLNKGGYFIDADLLAHPNAQIQKSDFEWQLRMFKKHLHPKLAEEWIEHYREDAKRYFKLEELIDILREIGFQIDVVFREKLEAIIIAKKGG